MENTHIARCMKCRKQQEVKDPIVGVNKRGVKNVSGVCPICGTKMFCFLKKETEPVVEKQTIAQNEPIAPFISSVSEFKGEKTTTTPENDIEKEIEDWDKSQL